VEVFGHWIPARSTRLTTTGGTIIDRLQIAQFNHNIWDRRVNRTLKPMY